MRSRTMQAAFALALAAAGPGLAAADEGETDAPVAERTDTEHASTPPQATAPEADGQTPLRLLDDEVQPGETRRLSWAASESFAGISVPTPVLVAHGAASGPTLCLTAAVHGDELNGIEMVRRVLYDLDAQTLAGTVIGVPIVNMHGFRRSSRYLPDRRDLNRYFPGNPDGSSASRIAHSFFQSVVKHCDALVDLHTGSFHRTNLPQLRADLDNPAVVKLTNSLGATVVLHSEGPEGTLRRAATDAGIPAVTIEAGEPMRFQPDEVAHGVKAIRTLLHEMGMVEQSNQWGEPQPVYYESDWVRADTGGILFSTVELGQMVNADEVLGTVTDPITNYRSEIRAPQRGRILGMALNQAVIPGFAVYRIGIEKSREQISTQTEAPADDQPAAPSQAKQPRQPVEPQERPD